jgi:hypothetical protein
VRDVVALAVEALHSGLTTRRRGFDASVVAACLLALLGAATVLEPDPASRTELFHLTGSYLAVALLLLTVSGCAGPARGCARAARAGGRTGSPLIRNLIFIVARSWLEALTTFALAAPILAIGWEMGAGAKEILLLVEGLAAVVFCATLLGIATGLTRIPGLAGFLLAGAFSALLLWPASLGWTRELPARFPLPEPSPLVLLATFLLLASICWAGVVYLGRGQGKHA